MVVGWSWGAPVARLGGVPALLRQRALLGLALALGGGRWELGESFFEEVEGDVGGLGDDADVGEDGHEVDVAVPAGDDVGVDMAGDSGAGDFTDVDADVEALGVHGAIEGVLAEDEEFHDFGAFLGAAFGEGGGVAVGGDEEVAVDVGVFVEHEEAVGGASENKICVIFFRRFCRRRRGSILWGRRRRIGCNLVARERRGCWAWGILNDE